MDNPPFWHFSKWSTHYGAHYGVTHLLSLLCIGGRPTMVPIMV